MPKYYVLFCRGQSFKFMDRVIAKDFARELQGRYGKSDVHVEVFDTETLLKEVLDMRDDNKKAKRTKKAKRSNKKRGDK